jgi:hypothetical protein
MWLAQQDTSGQPPGNGWQQILSAPRGKQGPAGKSIVGPQGKPGRNGADAVLPENFIEDVMALASERKAFEDGRSSAEAITSFRGYFSPSETYSSGDVVNFDGGLYLCISGGRFESIAAASGSWELMLGVPKFSTPAYMLWQGQWQNKTYSGGMVVRDGAWTMVAKTQTKDRAAPQPSGSPYYVSGLDDAPVWETDSATSTSLAYGQSYNYPVDGYGIEARLWVDEAATNIQYAVWIVTDPEGGANLDLLLPYQSFDSTGWKAIPYATTFVRAGVQFDILVRKRDILNVTTFSGNWNVFGVTSAQQMIPLSGEIRQLQTNASFFTINYIDADAVDRTAEIGTLDDGDQFEINGVIYYITEISLEATYAEIVVTPEVIATNGLTNITFTEFGETPINWVDITDHYVGNDAVNGFFSSTGYGNAVEDQNAYGIDIFVQEAFFSPDWDVVAVSGNTSPTSTELNQVETEWVKKSATELNSFQVSTTDDVWTEIGRKSIAPNTIIDGFSLIKAKRSDAFGQYRAQLDFIAGRDSGALKVDDKVDYILGDSLKVRAKEEGNDIVYEVEGESGQSWDWEMVIFFTERT